jgi:HEAT repeat protein
MRPTNLFALLLERCAISMRILLRLSLVGALIALRVPNGWCEEPRPLSSHDRQVISGLIRDLDSPDAKARLDAVSGLSWIGSPAREAVPKLLATLKDEQRDVARSAAAAILEIGADHPLVGPAHLAALGDPKPEFRLEAMSTLEGFFYDGEESHLKGGGHNPAEVTAILNKLGPAGRRIVPALITNLRADNPKVREAAVSLLWDLGTPARDAVPGLIASLRDPSEEVRARVPGALISVGPDSTAVVPALFQAMRTGDPIVQGAAKSALETRFNPWGRYLEPRPAADLPALIAALTDPNRSVRATSAFCLWAVREQTAPEHAALTAALEDSDDQVRLLVAAILIATPPHNPKAEAILVAALPAPGTATLNVGSSVATIEFYADVLTHLGPKAQPGIPFLITAGLGYGGQSGSPRGAAERAFKDLGPVAVPDLVRALRGNNGAVRSEAARVLGMIGPDARASVPALVALLDENERRLAEVAGYALGRIGPAAREAIPVLERRLRAAELRTRVQAADILHRIDPDTRQVMPILKQALEGDDHPARSQAIATLGSMGPQALPLLERVLTESKDPLEGPAIYRALAAIDPGRKSPDSVLITMLANKDRDVRLAALRIAQEVGPEAKGCVHAVERELDDNDSLVKTVAKHTLVAIDPGNTPLVSHLLKIWSTSTEPGERQEAADLLGRCGERARNAIPALRSGLDVEDREVQGAAAAALWNIDRNEVPIYIRPRVMAYLRGGFR